MMRAVSAHFLSVPSAMGIGPMKITAPPPDFTSVDCIALIIMKTMPRIMRSMHICANGASMSFCWILDFLCVVLREIFFIDVTVSLAGIPSFRFLRHYKVFEIR